MKKLGLALALLSTSALGACGSHNRAPVYYGTAPTQSAGRVYTAPGQYSPAPVAYGTESATYPAPRTATYSGGVTPAVGAAGLAPLTPISESGREGRVAYEDAPQYLPAAASPVYLEEPIANDLPGQVTVLPGDTVYAIARRTGASPQAIIALNSMRPPYELSVGQTVRVPSSAVPPSRMSQPASSNTIAATPVSARPEGQHVVRPGDTLYSISRSTGASVADLARANQLRAPYQLNVGQTLRIPGGAAAPATREAAMTGGNVAEIARNVSYEAPPAKSARLFEWPVQGAVIGNYGLSSAGKRNDGVNIAAPVGTPVRASADGEVVYRGSELQGYGNLILIKHEDGFVTAYAHNDAMLVKKGDRVRQGQVIAKVGQTGSATEPQLHFEIRQNLKAVDPVALLEAS